MNDRRAVTELVPRLPYPLSYCLNKLLVDAALREEGVMVPRFPYSICALNSLLVRLAAVIGIQSYIQKTRARDVEINQKIVKALQNPKDSTWCAIAITALESARGRAPTSLADRFHEALTKKRNKRFGAPSVAHALGNSLVNFRNDLIHGHPITAADIDGSFGLALNTVIALDFLAEYELLLRQGSRGYRLAGARPEPVTGISPELPEGEPCLVRRDGAEDWLSLSPLLVFREKTPDGAIDYDELFFLNAGVIDRLSYIAFQYAQQMDGRQLGSYQAFRKFLQAIPAPLVQPDPVIDFSSYAADHTRLFVGREDVIDAIARFVTDRPAPCGVVTALAGMGKTALFARLFERRSEDASHRWIFHFCMPADGRDSPAVALRSLTAQVCDTFGLDRLGYLSTDFDEMKEKFSRALSDAAPQLPAGGRLVVVIDALDEGIPAGLQESVPSVIPDTVPEHVVFLVSYRVDRTQRNTRVESQLSHLSADARRVIAGASPLAGLTVENVRDFLSRSAKGETVPERTVERVWRVASAEGNGADPFFLRFVADGIESDRMDVTRAETIPESMDEMFDELWMSLPTGRDFLVHRILTMLAIMRDYGDDEMFAYLFGKDLPTDSDPLTTIEVASLRAQAGKLLLYDGDRYTLFHERFRHYLVGEQDGSLNKTAERR